MNSRATISGGISRKPDLQLSSSQQSRRASAVSIPISSLNLTPTLPSQLQQQLQQQQQQHQHQSQNSQLPPPQPPPPPPRKSNTVNESKRRNTTIAHPTGLSSLTSSSNNNNSHNSHNNNSNKSPNMIINSFIFIIYKQQNICLILQKSKYFHLWRREVIYLRESMKTRSERTTALMLGGVDESSLDNIEPTRKKTTKIGISLMRWILISMTSRNLTRAWRTWVEYIAEIKHFESKDNTKELLIQYEKENEELKNKLNEIKNKIHTRETLLRDGIAKNQIASIIRIKLKNSIKKRFDRWYRITWEEKYENELKRQKLKVDVGFQHIRSEREMVREIEKMSVTLKLQLMCTIAFYNWKIQVKNNIINSERAKWMEEKRSIFKELLLIKRGIIAINKKEEVLVAASKSRGMDIFTSLQNVGEKIVKLSNFQLDIPEDINPKSIENK